MTHLYLVRRLAMAMLLSLGISHVYAQNSYFICEEANGVRHLTDSEAGTKNFKNCQKRKYELPTVIAVPKSAPRSAPRSNESVAAPTASPANFPRVEANTQRSRDTGRRAVLEDELRTEEAKCNNLRKDFTGGEPERQGNERNYAKYQERAAQAKEDLARCDSNVAALKNELTKVQAM